MERSDWREFLAFSGCQLDELRLPWLLPTMYHRVAFMCTCDYVYLYFVIFDCALLENKLTIITTSHFVVIRGKVWLKGVCCAQQYYGQWWEGVVEGSLLCPAILWPVVGRCDWRKFTVSSNIAVSGRKVWLKEVPCVQPYFGLWWEGVIGESLLRWAIIWPVMGKCDWRGFTVSSHMMVSDGKVWLKGVNCVQQY